MREEARAGSAPAGVTAALLRLAWPLALSGLVTVVVASNDTILLGRLDADTVAAGAVAVGVYTVVATLLNGFGLPAQVIAARYRGAGKAAEAARSAESAAAIALWVAIPLTALLVFAANPLVNVIAGSAVDVSLAANYLRITAAGLPIFAVGAVLRGFATGIARSQVVLVSSLASAVLDVGASILFLWLGAGAFGVAAGTLLGSVVPAMIFVIWLRRIRREGQPVPNMRAIQLNPGRTHSGHREAWALGWPEALLAASGSGSIVVVTTLLAPAGPVAIATVRTLDVAEMIVWTLISSVGRAGTSLLAERIGAGDKARQRKVILATTGACGGIAISCAASLPLVTTSVLNVAIADPRVAIEAEPVVWLFWAQVLWMAGTATTNAYLRAHRDTRTPLRASLIGEYVVFLPIGVLLCRVLHLGVPGIYVAHHIFWATFLAVGLITIRTRQRAEVKRSSNGMSPLPHEPSE